MKLCLINHNFCYELEKLIRIFLPFEKIEFSDTLVQDARLAVTEICGNEARVSLSLDGNMRENVASIPDDAEDIEKVRELVLATLLYECFVSLTGYQPQWGILTGVRPAKLYSRLVKGMGESAADRYFTDALKVGSKKLSLCKAAVSGEDKITSLSKGESFSLYISIPFCPTRCSYCSFVSHSVDKAKKLIPQYVSLLCKELEITAKIAKHNNLRLETVYIGGGTPTAISADELDRIMTAVSDNFDLSFLREYTVEAGRPDTVTKEKLECIKRNGATRISINPQTMNDDVLKEIGRCHTTEQTVAAFKLAREVGLDNINMDLIAGLRTDTYDSFKSTVEQVVNLNPESVTVHSLSMKRSSTLNVSGAFPEAELGKEASLMVDYAREALTEKCIVPYYMYRQSKTVGNLENVGYAKAGYECLYNVYIMDETHTILACGASAVTKLKEPNGSYIERIFNFKYPYEYISRFNELIERKSGINAFYDKFKI